MQRHVRVGCVSSCTKAAMAYKVNETCAKCGRRFSYMSDDPPSLKVCPRALDDDHQPTERELVAMPHEQLRKRCPDELILTPLRRPMRRRTNRPAGYGPYGPK